MFARTRCQVSSLVLMTENNTDGFRVLSHQFALFSILPPASSLRNSTSFSQKMRKPKHLYWRLGRSVRKPGNKQSWRRPSPHLSGVWIARNMNGALPVTLFFERISQAECFCGAAKRMKVEGEPESQIEELSWTDEGSPMSRQRHP